MAGLRLPSERSARLRSGIDLIALRARRAPIAAAMGPFYGAARGPPPTPPPQLVS